MRLPLRIRLFYWAVFAACTAPLVGILWQAAPVFAPLVSPDLVLSWDGGLGPNPTETLLHETGLTAVTLLLAALAVTPIRRVTGWNRVQLVRRLVGVWSFVYAALHLTIYVALDQLGDLEAIAEDVFTRRFIFVGMLAFAILLVLTITSTNGMMRRLGKRWQRLHRLVYIAAIAGVVHFIWGQKADIRQPLQYAGVLAALFGVRVYFWLRKRAAAVRVADRQPAS